MVKATKQHREEIDFVGAWLGECTEPEQEWWVSNDIAYQSYEHWCYRNGVPPKQLRGFLQALRGKKLETDAQKKINGKVHKGVKGFRVTVVVTPTEEKETVKKPAKLPAKGKKRFNALHNGKGRK